MKKIVLNADISQLNNIFSVIDDILSGYEISPKSIMQLKLVIEEIFSNICNYAYDDDGKVELNLDFKENILTFTISFIDEGKSFNPILNDNPDITLNSDDRNIGGLGIFIVKKNVDDINYEQVDGKNILTIKKRLV